MSKNNKSLYFIKFPKLELSEAGRAAKQLREDLLEIDTDIEVHIDKEDKTNMDFGSILVLALGTQAVVEISKGIANYLKRERATIDIISKDGQIIAKGIKGEDAVKIAEALFK